MGYYNGHKYNWTTKQEIEFLQGLGSWRDLRGSGKKQLTKDRKLKLIFGYIQSMGKRVRWGKIDPKKVLEFLNLQKCS